VAVICVAGIANAVPHQEIVNSADAKSKEEQPKYQAIVDANKKGSLKYQEELKVVAKQAEVAFKKHAQTQKAEEGSLVDQIIQNSKSLEIQEKTNKAQGIIIFVSFSMPKELLLSYHKQAQLYGGRLVIRGLVENSFKKTIKAMDLGNKESLIADINPRLFKDYEVTRIPMIVINHKDPSGGDKSDKFVGSVSLKYALEEASEKGDTKVLARGILEKNNLI
jgi:conjugal transfer pilus assembly protein TrbC